jgi:hypothetical protein
VSTLFSRIQQTYGVPEDLMLDLQLELVTPVFADWHGELAHIGRLLCDHHQSTLWREVYQLHFGADEYVGGDELLFLLEQESSAANPHAQR